ncbi:MAG: hypothetical protein QNJ34_15725 [Xenococcaceae cyanobacterium MO_188.B29]|nr:hypothetical protein [Xenococcaceae cyanobacterium MO_188.B29]
MEKKGQGGQGSGATASEVSSEDASAPKGGQGRKFSQTPLSAVSSPSPLSHPTRNL